MVWWSFFGDTDDGAHQHDSEGQRDVRNMARSSSSLANHDDGSSAAEAVLRPPMMTASRNSTVSSKL
jgi:hypothetical protein